MNFLSKTNFLIIGLFGTFILILVTGVSFSDFCHLSQPCVSTFVRLDIWYWANYIFIAPVILFFLLITNWMNYKIFEAWKKFAIFALPIILILTFLVTRDTGGSNFFSMDYSLYFLAIIYGLFFLGSLAVIIFTALKKT